jgi:hypothetical protein
MVLINDELVGSELEKYIALRLVENRVLKKYRKTLAIMSALSVVLLSFLKIMRGLNKTVSVIIK